MLKVVVGFVNSLAMNILGWGLFKKYSSRTLTIKRDNMLSMHTVTVAVKSVNKLR